MNWNGYRRFLSEKLKDAEYELNHQTKKHLEAKAKYEAIVREIEDFERYMSANESSLHSSSQSAGFKKTKA